jgi:hypothetical protein
MTSGRMTERLRVVLLVAALPTLVGVVLWKIVTGVRTGQHFGLILDQGSIKIQDFAWLLNFAKAFWRGEVGFGIEDHLRITEGLAGQRLSVSFPFGYSPTLFWVLGPLCVLPLVWGFVAWTLAGLVAVWSLPQRYRSLAVVVAFISPVAIGCWSLGQTAVLSTAALLALMRWDADAESAPPTRWQLVAGAAVIWALTAKPTLAVTAAIAFLAGRRTRVVAVAIVFAIVSTALLWPGLRSARLADYLFILTHYDLDTAPPTYAWSLVPATMGNVRALLHVTFGIGDAVASRWSGALWLLASAAIVLGGARAALAAELRWSLAVLAYLVFCPHVSWTEELGLAVIVAAVLGLPAMQAWIRAAIVAVVLAMLFLLPGIAFQGGARLPVVVVGKLVVAGLLLAGGAARTAHARSR